MEPSCRRMGLGRNVSAPAIKPLLSPFASAPRPLADPETLKANGDHVAELMLAERSGRAVLIGPQAA